MERLIEITDELDVTLVRYRQENTSEEIDEHYKDANFLTSALLAKILLIQHLTKA